MVSLVFLRAKDSNSLNMPIIRFICEASLKVGAQTIFDGILDLQNWPSFKGYGPLPGIRKAEYGFKTTNVVGTIIQVENTDGSQHTETIQEWVPEKSIMIELGNFSAPLSHLATHFTEKWSFLPAEKPQIMRREFILHAKSRLTLPFLWIISILMKRAVDRHSAYIQQT
jgi:hypothetical protein